MAFKLAELNVFRGDLLSLVNLLVYTVKKFGIKSR